MSNFVEIIVSRLESFKLVGPRYAAILRSDPTAGAWRSLAKNLERRAHNHVDCADDARLRYGQGEALPHWGEVEFLRELADSISAAASLLEVMDAANPGGIKCYEKILEVRRDSCHVVAARIAAQAGKTG